MGAKPSREQVILVHGSFATASEVEGKSWWQRGSSFHQFLSRTLPFAECQPGAKLFTWTGLNSERERRRAGHRLAEKILEHEHAGQPYHLVGHSHGGSVVWHALTELHHRWTLDHLRGVVTVGTPFLRYGFDRAVLWNLLPLCMALGSLLVLAPLLYPAYNENSWDLRHAAEPALQIVVPLLLLIIASIAVGTATSLLWAIYALRGERQEQVRQESCFAHVGSRYLSLLSRFDEAINGLATTLGFRGPILRRSEDERQSRWQPLELFRRLYDHCFAQAGDDFIWRQLSRRTQGNDLHGLRLVGVGRSPGQESRDAIIGTDIESELANTADEQARATLSKVRMLLDVVAARGLAARDLMHLVATASVGQELIHTIYFDNSGVRDLIASHLERCHGSCLPITSAMPVHGNEKVLRPPRVREILPVLTSGLLAITAAMAGWAAWTLAVPYTTAELMRESVAASPFLAATFETHEETCEFLRLSVLRGFAGTITQFVERIEMPDDKVLAHVCMARGYHQAGDPDQADQELRAALAVPGWHEQEHVPIGPPKLTTFSFLALLKEYGYLGRVAEASRLLPADNDQDAERMKIRATGYLAVIQGLVEGNRTADALSLLTAIPFSAERLEALDQILRVHQHPRETLPVVRIAFSGFDRSEALAKVVHRIAGTPGQGDPVLVLEEIEEASSRADALRDVVKAFDRTKLARAEELLRNEMASYERRPRLVGGYKKLSYIYFADAFRIIGNRAKAEELLRFAATLPKERDARGDVWDDISGPETVRLLTRLGNPAAAIPMALAQPDTIQRDELIRDAVLVPGLNFPWLRPQVRAIIHAIPDRGERLQLAIIEAESNEGPGELDRYAALAKETDLVYNSGRRSELLSSIARLMILSREYRRAISFAKTCRPADQLRAINALLLTESSPAGYNLWDWVRYFFRRGHRTLG
jgi:hypothetical protein